MIQRFIYTLLTAGFEQLIANPSLVEELFGDIWELDTEEVAGIITKLNEEPPTVIHGFARSDTSFPAISITLGSEGEKLEFMGDYLDQEEGGIYHGAEVEGAAWEHNYNIYVYADHPDVCTYYYEMVKRILIATNFSADPYDLWQVHIKGMELMPDPAYMPAHLFVRQIAFSCMRLFCRTDFDSRLNKAFQVAGIHVDKSGSPSDVDGVQTQVTTYTEGEDGEA